MKDKQTMNWIPLYVDKWIFGSTRIELEPAERGVFIDLMVLGAKDEGYIRANETTPFLPVQIAGILNIPVTLLESTIAKCLEYGKLEQPVQGIYRLCNWEKFQFTDRYKRKMVESSEKTEQVGQKAEPIVKDRIEDNRIGENKKPTSVEDVHIPIEIDSETWKAYLALRLKRRATNDNSALGIVVKKLQKLKAEGHDPKAVVEESIACGWTGVFPLKQQYGKPAPSKGCAPIPGKYDGIGEKV